MMRFFFLLRTKAGWRKLEAPEVLLFHLFLLLSMLLYSWVLGQLLIIVLKAEETGITQEKILQYVLYGTGIMGLGRMFLPSYIPLKPLVPVYYPLSAFRRHNLSLLDSLLHPYFLYLSIFLLAATLFSPLIDALFLTNGLLIVLLAELLRRLLQYLVDYTQSILTNIFSLSLAALSIGICLYFSDQMSHLIWASLTGILLLGSTSVFLEKQAGEVRPSKERTTSLPLAPFIKQLFLHPRVRRPLMVSFLVKLLFLAMDYGHFQWKGEHLLGEELSLWFLASPLALFSYLFNNSWGYWREVWLRMSLAQTGFLPFVLFQIRMMALPLIIDAILSLSILTLYWENIGGIIAYYLTISFFYIGSALFWSLRSPLMIRKAFQRKPTSSLSSFLTMFGAMMLTIMFWGNAFRVLIPLYFLAGLAAFLVARSIFPEWKYHIYQQVFKGKR